MKFLVTINMNLQPTHLLDEWIELVPLQPHHFQSLYAVASDPLIWEQHPANDRYKLEVFRHFFDSAIADRSAFVVIDRKTGRVIGSSRYYEYHVNQKSVAVGYTFLARAYWGGQYNQFLKKLMLDYAFKFVDTVFFHIGENNVRSQLAIQRIGAKKLERVEEKLYNQRLVHNFIYELTKKDWLKPVR
jgi:RimJ/RimL family protein N-acetyltransferase